MNDNDEYKMSNWDLVFWALAELEGSNLPSKKLLPAVDKLISYVRDDFDKKAFFYHRAGDGPLDERLAAAQSMYEDFTRYVESL